MTHSVLSFLDLLDDTDQSRLSWSKIGVASSTVMATLTGFTAALQGAVGNVTNTEWGSFAAAIGLHAVTHAARAGVRYTQQKAAPDDAP
jgi:hypothetical protein